MPMTRKVDLFAFLIGCFAIGCAYYLELYIGLKPCPLCTIQRIVLLITMLLFLLGALLPLVNFARRFYHFFVFLAASAGIAVAGRHAWLTTLPANKAPSCEASLNLLFKYLPIKQVAQLIYQGGGDCNVVTWRFLNINLPTWSLISFIILALIALWQVLHKDRMWIK